MSPLDVWATWLFIVYSNLFRVYRPAMLFDHYLNPDKIWYELIDVEVIAANLMITSRIIYSFVPFCMRYTRIL